MRTLFIDFDGTICTDRFWRSLSASDYAKVQNFLSSQKDLIDDWMRGNTTSEEVNRMVSEATGITYENLWNVFVEDCRSMHIEPEILECVKKLRQKFYVVLLTDNMDCFSRFTVPSLDLRQYFDLIVNSANEKQLKNDNNGELFTKYLKGNITDAILIDNSPKSCQIFETLGGRSYRVSSKADTLNNLARLF